MNPDRLTALIEAYCTALRDQIKAQPAGWLRFAGDTPDAKAVRVAMKTHELISAGHVGLIQWWSDAFKVTCAKLKIGHSQEAISNYLEG